MTDDKLFIDLDHPVWHTEPGFGVPSSFRSPFCAVGKAVQATWLVDQDPGHRDAHEVMDLLAKAMPPDVSLSDVSYLNDEIVNGTRNKDNHNKAVRLLLESLARGGKVEFSGTKATEVVSVATLV